MGRGVIGFRVSPVDVAYAVKLCVTGFLEGPEHRISGTYSVQWSPNSYSLAPPIYQRNYKPNATPLYRVFRTFLFPSTGVLATLSQRRLLHVVGS